MSRADLLLGAVLPGDEPATELGVSSLRRRSTPSCPLPCVSFYSTSSESISGLVT